VLLVGRVDAGKVELDGAQYLGFNLPFSISQLIWIEAILVGGAEIYRNRSTDLKERIYPGGCPAHRKGGSLHVPHPPLCMLISSPSNMNSGRLGHGSEW
jgi:hypothetical protein